MSNSFAEPAGTSPAESDVADDDAQVEPDADSKHVGQAAGDDVGYAGEQGAEARAAAEQD